MLDSIINLYFHITNLSYANQYYDKHYKEEVERDIKSLKILNQTLACGESLDESQQFVYDNIYEKYSQTYCPGSYFEWGFLMPGFSKSRRQDYFFKRLEIDQLLGLEDTVYSLDKCF